jgi:hypothetical protein
MNAITPEKHEELKAKIEPLRQQVESWRQTRGSNEHMPEALWEGAIALAKVYGVSPVQRILRIDYRGLERRALGIVKPPSERRTNPSPGVRQSFVELPTLPSRRAEHVVELEDGTGRKLTVKVVGGQLGEVLPLAQAFWRPGV